MHRRKRELKWHDNSVPWYTRWSYMMVYSNDSWDGSCLLLILWLIFFHINSDMYICDGMAIGPSQCDINVGWSSWLEMFKTIQINSRVVPWIGNESKERRVCGLSHNFNNHYNIFLCFDFKAPFKIICPISLFHSISSKNSDFFFFFFCKNYFFLS